MESTMEEMWGELREEAHKAKGCDAHFYRALAIAKAIDGGEKGRANDYVFALQPIPFN